MREGGCLCGAIRYSVTGETGLAGICHCETCRRTASAPSLPFSTFKRSQVTMLRGNPVAFRSSPHVLRSFCGTCGSPLSYANGGDPDSIDIMTCSLDDPDAIAPEASLWTSEKLTWDRPNPTCPAYPRTRQEGSAA